MILILYLIYEHQKDISRHHSTKFILLVIVVMQQNCGGVLLYQNLKNVIYNDYGELLKLVNNYFITKPC